MPVDIRTEMDRLATISEANISAAVAQSAAHYDASRTKNGPGARIAPPFTYEQARDAVESGRRNDLDWMFFRRWRLPDGWLTPEDATRALEIFHDPLAIAMRRAVVGRLYPSLPFLAEQ